MIIHSLLDTDLYKLTMMQGVLHQFPWAEVVYEFRSRSKGDLRRVADGVREETNRSVTSLPATGARAARAASVRHVRPGLVAEHRYQPGPGQHPHGPFLLHVDHDRISGLTPGDERDDAVVARVGPLHHAFVAVDQHARQHRRGV